MTYCFGYTFMVEYTFFRCSAPYFLHQVCCPDTDYLIRVPPPAFVSMPFFTGFLLCSTGFFFFCIVWVICQQQQAPMSCVPLWRYLVYRVCLLFVSGRKCCMYSCGRLSNDQLFSVLAHWIDGKRTVDNATPSIHVSSWRQIERMSAVRYIFDELLFSCWLMWFIEK